MQLVIFDFCETLVNFQSADRFVDYIIEKEKYHKYRWIHYLDKILTKFRVLAVLNKLFSELNPSKRLKLLQIKGISNQKINQHAMSFYNEKVMNNLIPALFEKLQLHVANHDHVVIISGGYAPYLKIFADKHQANGYFGTEMGDDGEKLTGRFLGKDCLYGQKVLLLEQYLQEHPLVYSKSIVYSDSSSDLPLLAWADEGIVVSKHKSQSWADHHGLKEIIHE